jgi:hypothetical protein
MKRMITILATLFLLNNIYSQDYNGVDDAFFSSIQVLLNNASGKKIDTDKIIDEQVFTSALTSISYKKNWLGTYIEKYVELDWSGLLAIDDYTYISSVDDNPKLYKLRLTFSIFSPIKRYSFFKGQPEGDFLISSHIEVFFVEKDLGELRDILRNYKIYPRNY